MNRARRLLNKIYRLGTNAMGRDYVALKRSYDRDGFVRIDPFLTAGQLLEVEEQLIKYLLEVIPHLPPEDVVYETGLKGSGQKAIRNLWRMERYSEFFAQFARDAELQKLVGLLVNGTPELMAVELFAKPARVGSAVPYHQDNAYFNYTPADVLTCWIALDDANLSNGCVYYARGSHDQGVLPHTASHVQGNSLKLLSPPRPSEVDEFPGILKRGGAIIHHCCLLHRSEQNTSERPRRGLLLVYRGAHCKEDPAGMKKYLSVLEEAKLG